MNNKRLAQVGVHPIWAFAIVQNIKKVLNLVRIMH